MACGPHHPAACFRIVHELRMACTCSDGCVLNSYKSTYMKSSILPVGPQSLKYLLPLPCKGKCVSPFPGALEQKPLPREGEVEQNVGGSRPVPEAACVIPTSFLWSELTPTSQGG